MSRRKLDPLLAVVMAAIHRKPEAVPPGYHTIDQWAKRWDVSRTMATKYIHKAVEIGLMDKKSYLVMCRKDARPYPTAHYCEKAGRKKA
jgi:Fic family protein